MKIKDGMVVETRDGMRFMVIGKYLRGTEKWTYLEDYDNKYNNKYFPELDIMAVYDVKDLQGGFTETLFSNQNKVAERKRDIDWTKVPQWTRIEVSMGEGYPSRRAYFYDYSKLHNRVRATSCDEFTYTEDDLASWPMFNLFDPAEAKEDWFITDSLKSVEVR